jgi:hypothetical protein
MRIASPSRTLVLLVVWLGLACHRSKADDRADSSAEANPSLSGASAVALVEDLVRALTPLPPSAAAGSQNDWYAQRRAILERMRVGGADVGRAALCEYTARSKSAAAATLVGLLDVAAHNVPEEVAPELERLVKTYGPDLLLRGEAAAILAQTSPDRALSLLEPFLRAPRVALTLPPSERLLAAWICAADARGVDKADLLCALATDLGQAGDARTLATKALATCPAERVRPALESLLVESSGNNYVRRIAAQSLCELLPAEDLCATLREVASREADPVFAAFLGSMMDANCR